MQRWCVVLWIVAAHCSRPKAPECSSDKPCALSLSNVVATENPNNVLSLYLSWSTDSAASTEVVVTCDDGLSGSLQGAVGTQHKVYVMGLLAGAHCTLEARSNTATHAGATTVGYDVAALPAYLPSMSVTLTNPAAGWTLFNLTNLFDKPPLALVMVDAQGRIRWYHRRAISDPGEATDVHTTAEGVVVTGPETVPSVILDWQGSVVWQEPLFAHHEIYQSGPRRFLYPHGQTACADGFWSDAVREWDRDTSSVVWEWRLCDHYTPPMFYDGWSHINSVELFARENAVLLSARDQSTLFKVDRTNGTVAWSIGAHGNFALATADQFLRQHAAHLLANGHILLFDNGLAGVREYSRALELAYDEKQKTATVVWQYRNTPDIFSPVWSEADRLDNGNTVITFGQWSQDSNSQIVEVDPSGTPVWRLVLPLKWGVYRSQRLAQPTLLFDLTEPQK